MEALDMDDAPVYGELIVFGRDGMTEQGRFPLQANALLGRYVPLSVSTSLSERI